MLHHFQCHVCLQYACFVVGLYLCVLVCEPTCMLVFRLTYLSLCPLGGLMEHWLRDEAVDSCMKCNSVFSFTDRKHHCRSCGKIICARYCREHMTIVLSGTYDHSAVGNI